MKLLKMRKQIIACACGLCMILGVGGVVALQQNGYDASMITAGAAVDTVIGLDSSCYINNENTASRFRLPFNAPICDKNAGTGTAFQAGTLADLNGLEDKLLIAGKTPREWNNLDVGFSISFRTSQQPVFSFDKNKLGAWNQNFFNGPFVVELKEDCVLDNDYGTVKAFAVYSDAFGGSTKLCGTTDLSPQRKEGPFFYEGVVNGLFQVKMWFGASAIQADSLTEYTAIKTEKMEGLQHALYFNGKSLAEWELESALEVQVRPNGAFVFRFDPLKFDTSKSYFIEMKNEVQTTKGIIQPFKYSVKAGLTNGNFYDSNGIPNGNGMLIISKPLTLQDRVQGPFLYEGVTNGLLQVKMWFQTSVIQANDVSKDEENADINKMEGLQHALYFNGKSLSEWASEGALGPIMIRSGGGFIFRFNTSKFDTSKAYLIEVREEVQTTKGVVQPFAYWVKPGLTSGNFFNGDGSATGNGYVYQDKTFEFSHSAFELKVSDTNTLKMWFTDGTATAPVISSDNGEGLAATVTHLEGLENALKIDGKTIAEWETLLEGGFSMGSRARDGRFTPQFNITALGENNFIGKNFVVELENDCMTSQGVVKAFKYVYNWAMKEGVLNPTEESVSYASADFFHTTEDDFFYFDVTFDKAIVKTAPTIDMPLSNDALQKADLNNLVKVNGKDMASTMAYIHVVKDKTDTLRFSVKNEEKSHNFNFTLLAGYVFPNGNVLADDITLYYNEQNGKWQTTAMPAITIVYNANGGEGTMVGETVAYGSDYVLPANTFTKQGHEFVGWAWTADAKVRFQDQENIHMYVGGALENVNDGTLQLYAVWQKERGVRFMSISMAGDIGLNFYVDLDDATDATATISMKGKETTVVGVYQESLACWKFTYGVAPKDYQETVSIAVGDVTAEYSVEQYGMDLPADNEAYAIVSELMDYCEAARIYFAGEEATETEDLTADLTDYQSTKEGEEEGVTIAGATLVLESKTTINVYVTAENLEGVACTVDGEAVTPVAVEGQDGQYVISITGIVSKDLDKTYTITIGGYIITYSALSYVETTLADANVGVALENLAKALYSLSVQAEEYFQ